jgi:hypothetical protein
MFWVCVCVCVSHPTTTTVIHFSNLNIAYTMRNDKEGEPPPPLVEHRSRLLASEERMELPEGRPVVNRTVAAVTMKDTIFWNVMPCSLVDWQTCVTCLLGVSIQKMEAATDSPCSLLFVCSA